MKGMTKDEFLERMFEHDPSIEFLSEYQGSKNPISCYCTKCTNKWTTKASNLLSGTRCPKMKYHEDYKREHSIKRYNERFAKIESDFMLMSEFSDWCEKIHVKCKTCGYEDDRLPRTILNGGVCPICDGKRRTRSLEEFVTLIPENVEIMSGYENIESRVSCRCKKCGNEWDCYAYNLRTGHGCKVCGYRIVSEKISYTKEQFDKKLADITQDVICIGDYTRTHNKALFKCCKCGYQFRATPHNVLQGSRCPKCSVVSKGEELVSKFLEENNMQYIPQMKFDGLVGVGGRKLSYDFYLPEYNILIEYQGIQHYQPIPLVSRQGLTPEEQFAIQINHDERKRNYARDNGFNLLEIPYQQIKDIPNIIKEIKEGGMTSAKR